MGLVDHSTQIFPSQSWAGFLPIGLEDSETKQSLGYVTHGVPKCKKILFLGDQTMQMQGEFEWFPHNSALFGMVI